MKQKYVVLEYNLKDKSISPIWGPFISFEAAANFTHRRIIMLCKEWDEKEDGFLFDHLKWEIRELTAHE